MGTYPHAHTEFGVLTMDNNQNLPISPELIDAPEYITIKTDNLTFRLDIFEGPLDLLLALIAKNKVNIYDIPIALILDQYLEYIHQMDLFNLDVASEFIVMAAQLMVIKSRLLLPKQKDDEEDPRQELVDLLLEYKRAKQTAEILHDLEFTYAGRFEKPPSVIEESAEDRAYKLTHELEVLTQAYRRVYERNLEFMEAKKNAEKLDNLIMTTKHVSVNSRISHVMKKLSASGKCKFTHLFEHAESRSEIVATFLAVLELIKGKEIMIEELSETGDDCNLILLPESEREGNEITAVEFTE